MKESYLKIKPFNCAEHSKESALLQAIKYQKRLLIPKIYFIGIGITVFISFLTSINIFGSDNLFLLSWLIIFFGGIISILIITVGGICPYCQNFQKMTGRAIEVGFIKLGYSKGVSPFISKCTKCGAPLSKKEVEKMYQNSDLADHLENELNENTQEKID